ncbi:MAG: hypothetical protein U0237_16660 [Thermoleophilia bacterium]
MPHRLTLSALAAAAALTVIPASGMGAIAALQDDRLAATPLADIPARLDAAKATGVRVARVDLFWNEIAPTQPANPTDPNDPAYDWRTSDAKIQGYLDRGITVLVSVYSSPTWATGGLKADDSQYNPFAPAAGTYGPFMQAVATRYSGSFTPAGRSTPLGRVRLIEVWNEPGIEEFLRNADGSSQVPTYLRLLREAYPAVKAGNPSAIVIAGVASPRSSDGDGNVGSRTWLRRIAGAPLSVKFDAYSQHVYPAAAPISRTRAFPSWNSMNEIFATLDARRAREIRAARGAKRRALIRKPKMKLYITEAGYTTATTPFRTVKVSDAQQATYMRQIFNHPQVRNQKRISAIFWFNYQDNPNWPGGIIREDGSQKPAYSVFTSLTPKGALTPDLRP